MSKTQVKVDICVNCKVQIGTGTKVAPTNVDGELWCPHCFAYHRAQQEPERWKPFSFAAVKCGSCGYQSVALGISRCGMCTSPSIVILPPNTKLVTL